MSDKTFYDDDVDFIQIDKINNSLIEVGVFEDKAVCFDAEDIVYMANLLGLVVFRKDSELPNPSNHNR